MKKLSLAGVILILSSAVLQGCAHGEMSTRLDGKLAQETAINTKNDLAVEAGDLIDNAPGLTLDQRGELRSIRDQARAELEGLRVESLKLRSVLIKDVTSSKYDPDEVDLVKQKITEVEDKRISVYFDAVKQANDVMGRWASVMAPEGVTPDR